MKALIDFQESSIWVAERAGMVRELSFSEHHISSGRPYVWRALNFCRTIELCSRKLFGCGDLIALVRGGSFSSRQYRQRKLTNCFRFMASVLVSRRHALFFTLKPTQSSPHQKRTLLPCTMVSSLMMTPLPLPTVSTPCSFWVAISSFLMVIQQSTSC